MATSHLFKQLRHDCLKWRLTLFGRSLLLILCEILANAACWIAAGIAFGRREETRSTLSLALLAWVRSVDNIILRIVFLISSYRPLDSAMVV